MMILIKVADISNEARPMEVADVWLECLFEEYFNQVWRQVSPECRRCRALCCLALQCMALIRKGSARWMRCMSCIRKALLGFLGAGCFVLKSIVRLSGQHGFALKSIVRLCSAWATRLCIKKHCFDVKSIAGLSGPHGFALKSIAWFSGPHGFALHSIAWRSVLCRTWVLNLRIVQLKVYEIFVISFCPAFLSKVGIILISLTQEFISVHAFSFQSVCLILIFLHIFVWWFSNGNGYVGSNWLLIQYYLMKFLIIFLFSIAFCFYVWPFLCFALVWLSVASGHAWDYPNAFFLWHALSKSF